MKSARLQKESSSGHVSSPGAAKAALQEQGVTLREFAKSNGFKYRTVSEVVRGVNKGLYGEGHRVAVKLGIKGAA
jgi:gp16 family phage-associated protein